jgi:hypothetical protein
MMLHFRSDHSVSGMMQLLAECSLMLSVGLLVYFNRFPAVSWRRLPLFVLWSVVLIEQGSAFSRDSFDDVNVFDVMWI